jgi:hypothetical protein
MSTAAATPQGVPAHDYVPLLALLRRRLSEDEIVAVASELMSEAGGSVGGTDVRVAITKVTEEMPSQEDTGRVRQRLVAADWPVDDAWGLSD